MKGWGREYTLARAASCVVLLNLVVVFLRDFNESEIECWGEDEQITYARTASFIGGLTIPCLLRRLICFFSMA
jgi:hypothetical protein